MIKVVRESRFFVLIFSQISKLIWMKYGMQPWPVGLFKLMFFFFRMTSLQGRERYLGDWIFKTGLRSDFYEPIFFFNLGLTIGMIKNTFCYQFERPWRTLKVTDYEKERICAIILL